MMTSSVDNHGKIFWLWDKILTAQDVIDAINVLVDHEELYDAHESYIQTFFLGIPLNGVMHVTVSECCFRCRVTRVKSSH